MMLLYLVLLLPLFGFLRSLLSHVSKLPPGTNAWRVLRTMSQFKDKPHVALLNLAKIHGPLISFRLGGQLIVVASTSAIAKEVLKTHDRTLSGRYLPSPCYQVPGALSSLTTARKCNDGWKYLRGISHQYIFSSKAVDSKVEIRKEKVREMVEYLAGKLGEVVKLDDVVSMTVCNIVTSGLTSRDLMPATRDEKGDEIRVMVDEIVEMAGAPALSDLIPILTRVDFWSKANGVTMHRKMMRVWEDVIRARRRECNGVVPSSNGDFLDVLVQNGFLDDQICIILTELLIAGTDSTIITVIWLIVELMRNPEILSKVLEEIAQAAIEDENEGTIFNESLLSNCEYFQACIKETLRLHIPGPFLVPHRAIETCQVNKYVIPKDSIVLVNAWAIQRDPHNWKDASSYNPTRFLGSKIDFIGPDLEFLPFSAGRRMCPGYHMGFRNVGLVVASLLHNFDWSLPGGDNFKNLDIAEKFGTTLKMEKALHLIPSIRKKSVV